MTSSYWENRRKQEEKEKKKDCKHKKESKPYKKCTLKDCEIETENAEINICGNCSDYKN